MNLFRSLKYLIFITVCITLSPASLAANGGSGEFEVTSNLIGDKPSGVRFKGNWKLWTLFGEPVKAVNVKWKVGNCVSYGGTNYCTGSGDECGAIPQSVINAIRITDFEITIYASSPANDRPAYLRFNADAMAESGGLNKYGEFNFTVPGSPNWDELFTHSQFEEDYYHPGKAKALVKAGISTIKGANITRLEYDMSPVRDWLNGRECKEKEKDGILAKITSVIDDLFDKDSKEQEDLAKTKANPDKTTPSTPTDFTENLTTTVNTDSTDNWDFASQLSVVEDYREDLEREAERKRKAEQARIDSIKDAVVITSPSRHETIRTGTVMVEGRIDTAVLNLSNLSLKTKRAYSEINNDYEIEINPDGSFQVEIVTYWKDDKNGTHLQIYYGGELLEKYVEFDADVEICTVRLVCGSLCAYGLGGNAGLKNMANSPTRDRFIKVKQFDLIIHYCDCKKPCRKRYFDE